MGLNEVESIDEESGFTFSLDVYQVSCLDDVLEYDSSWIAYLTQSKLR